MGWINTDDLSFDTENLLTAAKEYRAAMQELDGIKTDLLDGVDNLLKSGWKSKAADAFSGVLMEDWQTAVKMYYDLMVTMADAMDYAASHYDLVQDELEKLKVKY